MTPVLASLFTIGIVCLLLAFIYVSIHALAYALSAAPAWWARNIIADDPNPELSHLDKRDGL